MHTYWRRVALLIALCLLAALNIAARPYLLTQEGEIIVSGIVFHDANGNQRKDAREQGLPNISVISQVSEAQGGAVNASTITAADGSFTIQTHMGDRISIVPGAGYKALASSGVIVRAGMPALVFPLYVDKVVVDRVIRMEPAAVTVPAPQIYISPLITVPAPVVNVQPVDVRIAPAEIVVQPASVHVSPIIAPAMLWAAVAVVGLTMLFCAGLIASAIRTHTRTLRDLAVLEMGCSKRRTKVNAENWRCVAEQVIADATGQVVTVEALLSMSSQPVPTMLFQATNSQMFIFCLGGKPEKLTYQLTETKRLSGAKHLAAAIELRTLWQIFTRPMGLPSHLPRAQVWHVVVVTNSLFQNNQQIACKYAGISTSRQRSLFESSIAAGYEKNCSLRIPDEKTLSTEVDSNNHFSVISQVRAVVSSHPCVRRRPR